MSKSIVAKLGLLVAASMILLAASLAFLAQRGVDQMSRSVEQVAERMLNEDIKNKNANDERSAETYGKAMSGYLASIAATPLWDFDEESLQNYAKDMLNVPNVAYAAIFAADGAPMAGEKKEAAHIKAFTSDILREGKTIGSVEIGLDTTYLAELTKASEQTRDQLIASFSAEASDAESAIVRRILLFAIGIVAAVLLLNVIGLLRVVGPAALDDRRGPRPRRGRGRPYRLDRRQDERRSGTTGHVHESVHREAGPPGDRRDRNSPQGRGRNPDALGPLRKVDGLH